MPVCRCPNTLFVRPDRHRQNTVPRSLLPRDNTLTGIHVYICAGVRMCCPGQERLDAHYHPLSYLTARPQRPLVVTQAAISDSGFGSARAGRADGVSRKRWRIAAVQAARNGTRRRGHPPQQQQQQRRLPPSPVVEQRRRSGGWTSPVGADEPATEARRPAEEQARGPVVVVVCAVVVAAAFALA